MRASALDLLMPRHVAAFEADVPSLPDDVLRRRFGVAHLHRSNTNENPLGPPEAARAVLTRWNSRDAALYPQVDGWQLRQAIAGQFGLAAGRVVLGNTANEVIALVIKAFCQPSDNIVTADRTFALLEWPASFPGIAPRLVPLSEHGFDDTVLLAAIDAGTHVVFLCNPNNPTGSWWDHANLSRFLDAVDDQLSLSGMAAAFLRQPGRIDHCGTDAKEGSACGSHLRCRTRCAMRWPRSPDASRRRPACLACC